MERTTVNWDSMYDLLLTNAQAGTATYDVLGMEACCFLSGIDKLGGLEDLTPYLERDPEFVERLTALTPVKWRGGVMELNWYIFPYAYVYNMDIFEQAGIEPPKNWDEMVEVTRQLNESGVVQYGFGDSGGFIHHVSYAVYAGRLAQLGGRMLDENGRAAFNSLKVWRRWVWKAFIDSDLSCCLAPLA